MELPINKIICGDCLGVMKDWPDGCINCIITSPPYWGLRAYNTKPQLWGGDRDCRHKWDITPPRSNRTENDATTIKQKSMKGSYYNAQGGNVCSLCGSWRGELGLEPTIELYLDHLMLIFDEAKRVLRKDGVMFVNIGDTYASTGGTGRNRYFDGRKDKFGPGNRPNLNYTTAFKNIPAKSLCNIPEKFCIAMEKQGWIKRCNIIWAKGISFCDNYSGSCMPDSAKDRPNKNGFEWVYMFTKNNDISYWIHERKRRTSSKKPKPDYVWIHKNTNQEYDYPPIINKKLFKKLWRRSNLWEGRDYWYEQQYEAAEELNAERPRMGQGNQTKYHSKRGYGGGGSSLIGHSGTLKADGTQIDNPLGRTIRNVFAINPQAFSEAHFATFPEKLVEPMIKMACPEYVCTKCGKAREKIYKYDREYETSIRKDCDDVNYAGQRWNTIKTEISYADCGCGKEFRPGVVLDMFRRLRHGRRSSCTIKKRLCAYRIAA